MLKRIGHSIHPDPELRMFKQLPSNKKEAQRKMPSLITPEQPKLSLLPGTVQSDGDYLSPLGTGAEFISRRDNSPLGYDAQHWQVKQKTRFARLLTLGQTQDIWVLPKDFCQRNKLVEVITDGTGNRSDRPSDMEPDAPDQHKLDLDA